MNWQLPLIPLGGVLIAVGAVGIGAHFMPLDVGAAAILVGGAVTVRGLQRNGVDLPKIPSLVVWAAIALVLTAVFVIATKQHQ